jgi:thymidylate synthase
MNKEHLHPDGRPYTKEEFVEKIKTDKEFAKRFGNLGKIYGYQWRNWNDSIDQISELIKQLKENPDSRRLLVSAWNISDLPHQVLPPCHYGFQVYTRELKKLERINIAIEKKLTHETAHLTKDFDYQKWCDEQNIPTRAISLMWNQRSVDVPLGLPFNIASYGLLLHILAEATNMIPDELIGNLGDCHIYENQIDGIKEQMGRFLTLEERIDLYKKQQNLSDDVTVTLNANNSNGAHFILDELKVPTRTRERYPLPTLNINTEFWPTENGSCGEGPLDAIAVFNSFKDENFCKCLLEEDIQLVNYQSHPSIKMPLSN